MSLINECKSRLRYGVPLRLDQTTGLLKEGINASLVEQGICGICGDDAADCGHYDNN